MKSKRGVAHQIPRKGGQIVAPPWYPLIMYETAAPFVNIIWIENHVIYVNAEMKSANSLSYHLPDKIPPTKLHINKIAACR